MFKASKRREKAGTHDFLIHYDGNKESNVHWFGSGRINNILEINFESPPRLNNAMSSHNNKGLMATESNNMAELRIKKKK